MKMLNVVLTKNTITLPVGDENCFGYFSELRVRLENT